MNPVAVSISNLCKTYQTGVEALSGIDLEVEQGDFFALLGANGAGKSTTIGVLCSLVLKSAGTVRIFDIDIDRDFARARRNIGVVPQEVNFNNFERALNVVVTQAGYYGVPHKIALQRAEKYMRLMDLWDKRDVQTIELSGGMKRRLLVVRALLHEPRLLILDEPTAGVDIELRRLMWDFLRELNSAGTTIILTTHYLEEAENLCRHLAIIDHGQIVRQGNMREVLDLLTMQTFLLDSQEALSEAPRVPDCQVRLRDAHTLEVTVDRRHSLNRVFQALSESGVEIASIRPRANRLEELFLRLISRNKEA